MLGSHEELKDETRPNEVHEVKLGVTCSGRVALTFELPDAGRFSNFSTFADKDGDDDG